MDWRLRNAEWLRLALCRLRVRLSRHACLTSETSRVTDWIVATPTGAPALRQPDATDEALDAQLVRCERGMREAGRPPALRRLAEIAGLDGWETDVLLLVAAPALDAGFSLAYAELHGDRRRDGATLQLALSMFTERPAERLLAPDCLLPWRPLWALRLIDFDLDDPEPLLTRRLSVDQRVADYLRGVNHMDMRLVPLLSAIPDSPAGETAEDVAAQAAELIAEGGDRWVTINVVGSSGCSVASAACRRLGLRTYTLDLSSFTRRSCDDRSLLMALLG